MSQMMDHMGYKRVTSGGKGSCRGSRGIKLNSKRFCVPRLRSKFMFLLRLLDKYRLTCGKVLRLLKKIIRRRSSSSSFKRNNSNSSSSSRSLVCPEQKNPRAQCRLRSYGRSNSFYAEAIADCLEFIKRSSVSADSNSVSSHIEDRSS